MLKRGTPGAARGNFWRGEGRPQVGSLSYEVACRKISTPRRVGAFRRRPGRFSWRTLPAPPHPLGGIFFWEGRPQVGSLSYRLRAAKFLPGRAVRFDEISSQTKRVRSELSTRQRSVPSHRARPRGVSSAPHEEGTDPARRSPAAPLPQAGLCLSARTALSPSAFCSMASAGRTRQPHHGHARRTRHSTPPAAPPRPCPRMRPIVHTHVHQLPSCPPPRPPVSSPCVARGAARFDDAAMREPGTQRGTDAEVRVSDTQRQRASSRQWQGARTLAVIDGLATAAQ